MVTDIAVVRIQHSTLGEPEWKGVSLPRGIYLFTYLSRGIKKGLMEVVVFEQGEEGQMLAEGWS